ncbi:phosphodiesterase [Vibrio sp. HA2012]|uniref:HD-GYP domain-containing protein n=1 Tax=Vibrio sp. HA2012 TaxID=1971595 RepID=UPI000C2C8DAD|nr:HD-GYP domain-containing protein [Vibrio sp. HA2012]PJC87463.1 phosphodiesterase [Vibrio sp. HA2012]
MGAVSEFHVNLREMITAIETAVSLVGINDTNHGKRVGYMACQLGHALGYSKQDLRFLFELGMLHDIGVSSNHTHNNLVANFDWDQAHIHCEVGYQLLKDFEPLSQFALPILYHHTPWSQLENKDVKPRAAMMANLVFLADRIDIYGAGHYGKDILIARRDIVKTITEKSGEYFSPDFIKAFLKIQDSESFWIALEDQHIARYVWDMSQEKSRTIISLQQLKQLSLILAYIVDQKSPFTAQHSAKVAELAKFIATEYGMPETQCAMIEIAGLLHDLGKLRTPDEILEKPGKLDELERAIMNQHSYETYEILRHISGLEDIADWAAFHHEGLNGHGYPFHPNQHDIPTEARIIAVADVFQALVQDRPYRSGMSIDEAMPILDDMSQKGKLDPTIVALVHKHRQQCFEVASGR